MSLIHLMVILTFLALVGIITGRLEYDEQTDDIDDDKIYNVPQEWCNMSSAEYYGLNTIFNIPRSTYILKQFSRSFYYLSNTEDFDLTAVVQHDYVKVPNESTDHFLYYKAELLPNAQHDLSLALMYGAQYYIDIFPNATNQLKYLCRHGATNYSECLELPAYINQYAYDRDSLLKVRLLVSQEGVKFFEMYQNIENAIYLLERSYIHEKINELLGFNHYLPLDMIITVADNWYNWSDVISVPNWNYRSIRHNIMLVLKRCQTSAYIKTYITNLDNLCPIVSKTGSYNLIYIASNVSKFIDDVQVSRIDGNKTELHLSFKPNFNMIYDSSDCFHEVTLYEEQSLELIKLSSTSALYTNLDFEVLLNETIGMNEILLRYMVAHDYKIELHRLSGPFKIENKQKNSDMRTRFVRDGGELEFTRNEILIRYQYKHYRREINEYCPVAAPFYIIGNRSDSLNIKLQVCNN